MPSDGHLWIFLFLVASAAACKRQPCEVASQGPTVRLDVALGSCNARPTAEIAAQERVGKFEKVSLDGSRSRDANGDLLHYRWMLDPPEATSGASIEDENAPQTGFTADGLGAYSVTLVVDDGDLSSDPVQVTILAVDQPPRANAGEDRTVRPGELVALDGAASSDPDGDPLTYMWTFSSRPSSTSAFDNATAARASFHADAEGVYEISLAVSDGASSDVDTVFVTAAYPNQTPDAGADAGFPDPDAGVIDGDSVDGEVVDAAPIDGGAIDGGAIDVGPRDGGVPGVTEVSPTGQFDPGQVWLLGSIPNNNNCGYTVFGHWSTPHIGLAGINCDSFALTPRIRRGDGRILHGYGISVDQRVYEFHPDPFDPLDPEGSFPQNAIANDVLVPTPGCGQGQDVNQIFLLPDDSVVYNCIHGDTIFDESGSVVFQLPPGGTYVLAVGPNGVGLIHGQSGDFVRTSSGAIVDLPGVAGPLSNQGYVILDSVRFDATDSAFLAAVARPNSSPELWSIGFDGQETLLGTYAPPPMGAFENPTTARLDANGDLYGIHQIPFESGSFLVRRSISGISTIIYDDSAGPLVSGPITLVTGQ